MPNRLWNSCILFFLSFFLGCSVRPTMALKNANSHAPDYSKLENWAAHPAKLDSADLVPDPLFSDQQDVAPADVFFIHPTTYTGDRGQRFWNAPIRDTELNKKTDRSTIRHQASIFNHVGRIYAPRYRQAHLHAFFTKKDTDKAKEAFEIAYRDIRSSFQYFLEHHHQNRPIIIAAHSQGSMHGKRLLKEYFEGTPLFEKLVVAYLVGWAIPSDYFKSIPVCADSMQTHCLCTWRTYRKGHVPRRFNDTSTVVVNPLNWSITKQVVAPRELNEGAILRKYNKGPLPHITDAQIHGGILWASRPKFPGSFLLIRKNYHVADYNFYWVNVRKNAKSRLHSFIRALSM